VNHRSGPLSSLVAARVSAQCISSRVRKGCGAKCNGNFCVLEFGRPLLLWESQVLIAALLTICCVLSVVLSVWPYAGATALAECAALWLSTLHYG
jgi:hypothetical protein